MNDSQLETTINEILEDKMGGSSIDINVQSKNGFVNISGMVDVLAEKLSAEKIVKHIDGVKKVENNITIATDGYIPDSDIEEYVLQKLKNDDALVNITPHVDGGAVTLIGRVKFLEDEQNAINFASQSRGAKSVASNIFVESKEQYDAEILANRINNILKRGRIDIGQIKPVIKDNNVTLNGFVEDRYEAELAEELVARIDGVRRVKNQLKTRE